ncbi:vesicular transporter [Coprinopsis sp. MPI-PUGE-AT-0042]|nr:vesicular transporter [Coprinopsis sp. MPI-PUGE-AT-0042]
MTTPFPTTRSNLSAPPISPMVRSVSLGSQSSSSQPNEPETPVPATPRRASLLSLPSGAGPGGAGGKSRARDLLRRHYGLGVGPPPAFQGQQYSPAFDAKSYYEQLITTSTLPMLLKQENELLSEIRQLDSERQSLVYNHHHELIAASDTIGAMKTHAESLESDLDLLRAAFSEISRLSAEVAIEDSQPNSEGQQERRQGQAHDRQ